MNCQLDDTRPQIDRERMLAALRLLTQELPVPRLDHARRARQGQLRLVQLEQALHLAGLGRGKRRLRGHQRQVIVHAGLHTLLLVGQRTRGQFNI